MGEGPPSGQPSEVGAFYAGQRAEFEGRLDEAERWLRRAARGGWRGAMQQLYWLLDKQGRHPEAEVWLRRAAQATPPGEGGPLFENLIGRLLDAGRLDEAEPWLQRLANVPDNVERRRLARLLVRLGRIDEAVEVLLPFDDGVEIGRILVNADRVAEAEARLRQALDSGENHDVVMALAKLLIRQDRLAEAEHHLRPIADCTFHTRTLFVDILVQQDRAPEAERWLRERLDSGGSNHLYVPHLVNFLITQGRGAEAASAQVNYELSGREGDLACSGWTPLKWPPWSSRR